MESHLHVKVRIVRVIAIFYSAGRNYTIIFVMSVPTSFLIFALTAAMTCKSATLVL